MRKNISLIGGSHGIGFALASKLNTTDNIYVASRTKEHLGNLDVDYISYDATEGALDVSQLVDHLDGRHPLKRVGQPEDIANVASFLLSDESSWITGQVLEVDGRMSTQNLS